MTAEEIRSRLRSLADNRKAAVLQRFFKTGPGEYGEGDEFLGIQVPVLRRIIGDIGYLPLAEAGRLLRSSIHEERLAALLILVRLYKGGDEAGKKAVYTLYLDSTRWINNWDLIDLTAGHIVGPYLADKPRDPLYRLALSETLWERRIAIMATFYYIRLLDFTETLKIGEMLLRDREDLIHKAVGWMLREVGKRSFGVEDAFLRVHYKEMPRTMLRYAIERFPEELRQDYLKGRA